MDKKQQKMLLKLTRVLRLFRFSLFLLRGLKYRESLSLFIFLISCISSAYAKDSIKSSHPESRAQTNVALQTLYNSDSIPASKESLSVNDYEKPPSSPPLILDHFEKYNRFMFNVNEHLDIYFMKPIATFYNTVMPKPLNEGVTNFFHNLNEVPIIINDLLQFNFYQMTNDIWRFAINTSVGIGGLFDVATRMNLPYYNNDFGLTLAKWGYRNSNYFVLPFFGSYTVRDGLIGLPVDYFAFSVYPFIPDQDVRYGLLALFAVDYRAQALQFQPVIEEVAIDKYIFVRNAAMQRRAFQIQENQRLSYRDREKTNESK